MATHVGEIIPSRADTAHLSTIKTLRLNKTLRLKLCTQRCAGKGDHVTDILHSGHELHQPLKP